MTTPTPTPTSAPLIVDLFCGAGGWAAGMHLLGIDHRRTLGVEWDDDAAATHAAAGFPTLQADIAELDPTAVADGHPVDGLIASPPCQAFSLAGKGLGRLAIPALLQRVHDCMDGWVDPAPIVIEGKQPADADQLGLFGGAAVSDQSEPIETVDISHDVRADLTLQPLRWALTLSPRWVACEQVPAVLPLWEAMARVLEAHGYSTWTGKLDAERYGVPQTRTRAVLLARRDGPAVPPDPTHTAYNHRLPDKGKWPDPGLDGGLRPWVSMAEALGWGMPDRPSYTFPAGHGGKQDGAIWGGSSTRENMRDRAESDDPDRWRLNGGRSESQPNRAVRADDEPAPTLAFGNDAASWRWEYVNGTRERAAVRPADEPAPTVMFGASANEVVWRMASAGRGADDRVGLRERAMDEPANTLTGAGSAMWLPDDDAVVETGANTMRHQRDHADGKYQRPVASPAPTLDAKVGGAWRIRPGRPAPTVTGGGTEQGGGVELFGSSGRAAIEEAYPDRPWVEQRNDQSGASPADVDWPLDRPATSIAGRDLVADPGANANRFNDSDKSRNDGIRVSVLEAAVLQTFPIDWPWQGTKTACYRQVGNAVPPFLAAHVLATCLPVFPTIDAPQEPADDPTT